MMSSEAWWAKTRGLSALARVALGQHGLADVHEVDLRLDGQLAARHLGPGDDQDLGADALPVLEVGASGLRGGMAEKQALGHELEEALEPQVVAQHLGDASGRPRGWPRRASAGTQSGTAKRWVDAADDDRARPGRRLRAAAASRADGRQARASGGHEPARRGSLRRRLEDGLDRVAVGSIVPWGAGRRAPRRDGALGREVEQRRRRSTA